MEAVPAVLDADLDGETIELLPARETLWSINVVNVIGVNISLALNAASFRASASALAAQQLAAAVHH